MIPQEGRRHIVFNSMKKIAVSETYEMIIYTKSSGMYT